MKKKIPVFKTDKEAEDFVDKVDLTEFNLSGLQPVQFEFEKKNSQLNRRVPKPLHGGNEPMTLQRWHKLPESSHEPIIPAIKSKN